jgi:hypothetical protein
MQTKLTLRLDERLIESAKQYSAREGISLSRLVADYFALLDSGTAGDTHLQRGLTPRVRALVGALAPAEAAEEDYRRYLARKHR